MARSDPVPDDAAAPLGGAALFTPARPGPEQRPGVFGPLGDAPAGQAAGGTWMPEEADPPTVPLPATPRLVRSTAWVRVLVARLVPGAWRGARVDPGRPGATALALVATAAAVAAAVGVWLDRPQTAPVPALPAVAVSDPTAPASAASPPDSTAPLVVSVSGKVRRPGLVRVPGGARVADVLDAAGGALPGTDLSGLNLARHAVDGEQVAVGVPPAPEPGGAAGAPAAAGPVDLNAATVEQLDALPGVGPVTAQKIVDWRAQHGRFARVEQLREVPGIGERKLDQLRGLVRV